MQLSAAMCRVAVLVLVASPFAARADLPVHCLRHQVAGDWEFTLGPTGPKRSSCGHQKPDNPNAQPALAFLDSQGSTSTVRFSLHDPSTVTGEDGSSGTWTMIYDEGFEVAVGDRVFFAFSDFEFVQDANNQRTNVSHCDKTQVGWYHNTDRSQWGCYFGRKVNEGDADLDSAAPEPPARKLRANRKASWLVSEQNFLMADEDEAPKDDAEDAKPAPAVEAAVQKNTDFLMPSDVISNADAALADYKPWVPQSAGYDKPMPDQWQQSVADALNFLQLGWTATSYANKFSGKSPKELNRFAGVRRHLPRKHQSPEAASFSSLLGLGSKVTRRHGRMSAETFDWRNKDGKNWLEPVVTQGDCGSCYTISTVHMLTARNKIQHGDTSQPTFSVTFPLFCSEYNQGCDGGYGFLQSKWSEDVGLVPESCSPFAQEGSCHALHGCNLGEKRYRATNHHYVGGFYGGSEAALIQRELVSNGPVVMSFEPKEDFMYYKSGIYKSGANKIHQEWEQVDHAVLLIGYGEENGQPYWTMQNSWGEDWGEEGYFRMARGIDESGCESIVVAAEVKEEDSNPVLDDFLAAL